jgi:hypothetical protein
MTLGVSVTVFVLLSVAPEQGHTAEREVLLGTVYKDTVFAVPKLTSKEPRLCPPVEVWRGPIQFKPSEGYSATRYRFGQFVADQRPYRLRIVCDTFWGNGTAGVRMFGTEVKRIPVEDLAHYDPTNPKRAEQHKVKYPKDRLFSEDTWRAHNWGANPAADCSPGLGPEIPLEKPPPPAEGVFFDLYPIKGDRVLLFVHQYDKIRVWSVTATWDEKHCEWDMDYGGKDDMEVERFKSPLMDAFTVFVRGGDYYFVTEYGDVWLARAVDKGERKMEKVWDGRRQPVHALITDATNDKVYCFVEPFFTDKQDEERVYFELSAKPEPTKYKLKKIEGVKIEPTLKSVLEYAYVLQADKKIK